MRELPQSCSKLARSDWIRVELASTEWMVTLPPVGSHAKYGGSADIVAKFMEFFSARRERLLIRLRRLLGTTMDSVG